MRNNCVFCIRSLDFALKRRAGAFALDFYVETIYNIFMDTHSVIGRFAPTPNGFMHAGNILCALISYLSVKSVGGKFLIRIEDLDAARCPRAAGEETIAVLERLGLKSDGDIIWQSERTEAYKAAENILRGRARLYPCFCTRAELHSAHAPRQSDGGVVYDGACRGLDAARIAELSKTRVPCVRIAVPDITVAFTDGVAGAQAQDLKTECGDFIIKRSDGVYAYQLAVVADDGASGVTQVVRGGDLLTSTPRQIFLQRLLGLPQPEYYHIPLVCTASGRKLGKSYGDSAQKLLQKFPPEYVIGALAYAAGIADRIKERSASELAADFDWKKLRKERIELPSELCD